MSSVSRRFIELRQHLPSLLSSHVVQMSSLHKRSGHDLPSQLENGNASKPPKARLMLYFHFDLHLVVFLYLLVICVTHTEVEYRQTSS